MREHRVSKDDPEPTMSPEHARAFAPAGASFDRLRTRSWEPTSACGAPLWMKMVAVRVARGTIFMAEFGVAVGREWRRNPLKSPDSRTRMTPRPAAQTPSA